MEPNASDPPLCSQPQRPKVVYVMGAGRSGSTILGVALGNCTSVFYAGELDKWLLRSGRPKLQDPERTQFWETVAKQVADAEPLFGGEAHRYLERSSALFRVGRWWARRRARERYRRVMAELYGAIATTAEVTHVVDSSHYPLRARELQSIDGIDIYLLFLMRDTRRVIESFSRGDVLEPKFSSTKTRAYLLLTYVLSVWVFLKQPRERRLVVAHEDFLIDPAGVMRSVLDLVDSSAAVPDFDALSTGIPLQGNRLIHKKTISLEGPKTRAHHRSFSGRWFDLPLTVVLSRLRPRAGADPAGHGTSAGPYESSR
jgi:hypothetical protein